MKSMTMPPYVPTYRPIQCSGCGRGGHTDKEAGPDVCDECLSIANSVLNQAMGWAAKRLEVGGRVTLNIVEGEASFDHTRAGEQVHHDDQTFIEVLLEIGDRASG